MITHNVSRRVRVTDERVLEVFDNESIRHILRIRRRDYVPFVELRRRLCLTGLLALLIVSEATHDGGRTGGKCPVSSHRTVDPGVPPSETWSTRLVMPAQPAPGECRRKYKYK